MSDDLQRVLRQLREQYIAESPTRLAELDTQLARAGAGDRAELKELARLFHRLAGSGGSYGIDAVTTAARAGEHLADDLAAAAAPLSEAQRAAFRAHIAAVAAAFDAARAAEPPATF